MKLSRLRAIINKEFLEIGKNRLLLLTIFLPPLLLTFLPLLILAFAGANVNSTNIGPDTLERYRNLAPGLANYSAGELVQLIILQQFLFFFLLMPLIIPVTVAAYSIIGEKELRSLEPLLATPVKTIELLAGKSIAAVVPAILTTWAAYLVFMAGVRLVASQRVFAALLDPKWLLAMLLLAPLLSLFSVALGIIVSSRVNDVRVAQQIVGVIILPVVLVGVGQTTGLILLNNATFIVGSLVVAALDVAVLRLGARLFQRETILTRWK